MRDLLIFLKQKSKSVLPNHYINIINSYYLRLFRLITSLAIISLFIFKSFMNSYYIYFLLTITYSYTLYQCTIIIIKIYYIHKIFIKKNKNIQYKKGVLTHMLIIYNMVVLFIVITGLPIICDTLLEIIVDIKYIIKQCLNKKDK